MTDFLLSSFFIPVYFITWVISMFTYKKYFDTVMRFFPIFIAYTFFTEILGYFITTYEDFSFFTEKEYSWHNVIIYNLYSFVTFLFFFWVYWKLVSSKKYKRTILFAAVCTLLSFIISAFLQDPMHTGLYFADIIASYSLLLTIILYFKEKRKEGHPFVQKNNLMFWVSIGFFTFYLAFPHLYFVGFEMPEIWIKYHFRKVLQVFIVIMYILFSIGLILGKRSHFK
ncbi:hypothetical protein MTsPCn9_30320 [Croceitalea sp. MTPC9]|uniref:hypothetical protein n=1 Tax=unclassified Croceitalea TaxID=2632280 RepID=UPI002B3DEB64|nr:hypothetical protein MTsPCn6_21330 [Croceitalea sp. MTPC6]GMN18092.1 hypothetical protein MTsPCn9_30320 [Croceitalea sp. MTPC9]